MGSEAEKEAYMRGLQEWYSILLDVPKEAIRVSLDAEGNPVIIPLGYVKQITCKVEFK